MATSGQAKNGHARTRVIHRRSNKTRTNAHIDLYIIDRNLDMMGIPIILSYKSVRHLLLATATAHRLFFLLLNVPFMGVVVGYDFQIKEMKIS